MSALEDLLGDPRVTVDTYIVRPTGYDEFVNSDKDAWCLTVVNGHAYGWSVRRGASSGGPAMNRHGKWIFETRGSEQNRSRRWPLEEALALALRRVDINRILGLTAAEASAEIAARVADDTTGPATARA